MSALLSVPLSGCYLGPERCGIWMAPIFIVAAMAFAGLAVGNRLMDAVSEASVKFIESPHRRGAILKLIRSLS